MLLRRYLSIVTRHWFGIAACTLLGALAAGFVALLAPVSYTAKTSLYISAQNGNDAMSAYQGGMFTQQRIKSYTELIGSERVASEVADRLNLPDVPEDLAREIVATSAQDTVLISVAVTDRSAQRATLIANAVGDVFPQLVSELEKPTDINALPTVRAVVVQTASIPIRPSSTGLTTLLGLGLIAGLIVGLTYAGSISALQSGPTGTEPDVRTAAEPPRSEPADAEPKWTDVIHSVPNRADVEPPRVDEPPAVRYVDKEPAEAAVGDASVANGPSETPVSAERLHTSAVSATDSVQRLREGDRDEKVMADTSFPQRPSPRPRPRPATQWPTQLPVEQPSFAASRAPAVTDAEDGVGLSRGRP